MSVPTGYIVHRSKGRMRLRVPAQRGNADLLSALAERLRATPGIRGVETRAQTGSILLEHDGAPDPILARVRDERILELDDGAPETRDALDEIAAAVHEVESRLGADLTTLSFYALITATTIQLARGRFLPAAETMLAHALGLLHGRSLNASSSSPR